MMIGVANQQKLTNASYHLNDLPSAMVSRNRWQERIKEIHAAGMPQ